MKHGLGEEGSAKVPTKEKLKEGSGLIDEIREKLLLVEERELLPACLS